MDGKPKLLDRLREQIRVRHYSIRTESAYVYWGRHFVRFHKLRHPADMGAAEVEQFLTHLAVERNVSASTQNQALAALLFLYKQVLGIELPWLDDVVGRSRRSGCRWCCRVTRHGACFRTSMARSRWWPGCYMARGCV